MIAGAEHINGANVEVILCVDDDPDILNMYRQTIGTVFTIETAESGEDAIAKVDHCAYAVVLSDMTMPGMTGIELLTEIRRRSPETVRIMLTGHADLQTAIQAVNEGNIFRFMTKPCPGELLSKALQTGIEQHRLIKAERELLEKTLKSSIQALAEVLALVNPVAFGRATRLQKLVVKIAQERGLTELWQLEIAALLSQLGCVTVPETLLTKVLNGGETSIDETRILRAHPRIGSDLIAPIPRMKPIADIIALQEKHFDGSGNPIGPPTGENIPIGARVLKLAVDFDAQLLAGDEPKRALLLLRNRKGVHDPELLEALERVIAGESGPVVLFVRIAELHTGMVLDQDVFTSNDVLLIGKGQEITESMIRRLKNYSQIGTGISEPIRVIAEAKHATKWNVSLKVP
ncbi:MAG: hypothetical protein AMXMBFR47_41970 [Planctomycetota bacterium]